MSRHILLRDKAALFFGKYAAANADGERAAWFAVCVELLLRSFLTEKNPLLNAMPDSQVAYLTGNRDEEKTKPANLVWSDARLLEPALVDHHQTWQSLQRSRNEYLHSEHVPDPDKFWEPRATLLAISLLGAMNVDVESLFGFETERLIELSDGYVNNLQTTVLDRVAGCKRRVEVLAPEAITTLKSEREGIARNRVVLLSILYPCPACTMEGRLSGSFVSHLSSAIAEDGTITNRSRMRSKRFQCWVCELELFSHSEVVFAGITPEYDFVEETSVEAEYGELFYERGFEAGRNYVDEYDYWESMRD